MADAPDTITGSKAPWFDITDGLPQVPAAPPPRP
jgi:hypothetical protein